jgi:hypothetical protein
MSGQVGIIHVHSNYSHDGHDSLARLRELSLERGIAFVALSDHAEDFDAGIFAAFTAECARLSDARLRLIPGLEYRFAGFKGMHLLAFGLREWIAPETPADFARVAPGAAALTAVAHPVLPRYRIPPEVLDVVDAIEIWNAGYNTRYLPDPRAIRLLQQLRRRRPEVVGFAGLDQHDASNDRELRILLDLDEPDPLAAIRGGRFRSRGRTMGMDAAVSWSVARLGALRVARLFNDRLERTQDKVARWVRRPR